MTPKAWQKMLNLQQGLRKDHWKLYQRTMLRLCREYQHLPIFNSARLLIEQRDWSGLLELADYLAGQKYPSAHEHFRANQLSLLIRKYPFPKGTIDLDPRKAAIEKFKHAEHKCRRVNQRFKAFERRSPTEGLLHRMRGWIAYVLGYEVPFESVWNECDFGPGASIGVHGNATAWFRKLGAEKWSVTPSAYTYGSAALKANDQVFRFVVGSDDLYSPFCVDPVLFNKEYQERIRFVTHNKIAFVPKTAKTFRSIAVEPLVNSYLQKGVDAVMRRRLRRVGIDLTDQSINMELARVGSASGRFATIDLSSASDSISIELVRNLLPPDWFDFLNAIRSKEYELDGRREVYHKFCSMGNGFCFPLETLLFTAACVAVGAQPGVDCHIYGDDIIVETDRAAPLLELLRVMGFTQNRDKTFLEGPFRESCGADWFEGVDVRPFTLDFELDSLSSLFKFYNLTQRNELCKEFFRGTRYRIWASIPFTLRFARPYTGNAETAMTVEWDQFLSSQHASYLRETRSWRWQELVVTAVPDGGWRRHNKRDLFLVIGVLRGGNSSQPYALRRRTRTRVSVVARTGDEIPAPRTILPLSLS